MNWNLSSPMIFLKRRALTAPLNCSTWGTCSSLYHLLNAASLSLLMVARTMKMVTAIGISPETTAACGHAGHCVNLTLSGAGTPTVPPMSGPTQGRPSASAPGPSEAGKQRLCVAPAALIERGKAGGEREMCALAFFDHGDGARCEPSARGCRCERPFRQTAAVGRIEEGQGEAAVPAGRPQLRGIAAEQLGDAGQPEGLDVAAQERARLRLVFDEQAERGAARQRLEPERARPREQVEHLGTLEFEVGNAMGKDVEDRLPHAVRGGPRALVRRRRERPAAQPPAHDPHRSSLRPASRIGSSSPSSRATRTPK